ncbi:MAG TPA: cyanophycinase [Candidatus Nanopelagicales bacterium]
MSEAPAARRRLIAIGGAEDKLGATRILRRFVAEAGGPDARIVVCPTASALGPEITELYENLFTRLGVAQVLPVRPRDRREADKVAFAEAVEDATGVFFTGGNQMKLASAIRGTRFGDAVVAAYGRGAIVGGTSAGASVVSEHMVGYGSPGTTPKFRMVGQAQGLGLLPGAIVDQHFGQRDRFGRLLNLVASSPDLLGIGLDEDTAMVVTDETELEVLGKGSVFLVDMRAALTDAAVARGTAPLMISGAMVHFLPSGARFDLTSRTLVSYRDQSAEEPAEPEPSHDLARISRRVAAEGVDDSVVARNARRRRRTKEHKETP